MKPVFVTGGSGFVGRALLRKLCELGQPSVALVRSAAAEASAKAAGATRCVQGDLDSVPAMVSGMRGCDVVYHCAAYVDDWGDRRVGMSVNRDGTRHVLAAAREAGVRRVVHVSTEALLATGRPILDADERSPIPWGQHIGVYSETKAWAEEEVQEAVRVHGQDVVIVRPRFIWGPGDTTLLPRFCTAMLEGQWIWVDGGHFLTSTCHIDNCLEGMLLAADSSGGAKAGEAYFLTDGPARSQREVITSLVSTQGVPARGPTRPRWLVYSVATVSEWVCRACPCLGRPVITRAGVGIMFTHCTVRDGKARRELGYQGRTSWEEGLEQLRRTAQGRQ